MNKRYTAHEHTFARRWARCETCGMPKFITRLLGVLGR